MSIFLIKQNSWVIFAQKLCINIYILFYLQILNGDIILNQLYSSSEEKSFLLEKSLNKNYTKALVAAVNPFWWDCGDSKVKQTYVLTQRFKAIYGYGYSYLNCDPRYLKVARLGTFSSGVAFFNPRGENSWIIAGRTPFKLAVEVSSLKKLITAGGVNKSNLGYYYFSANGFFANKPHFFVDQKLNLQEQNYDNLFNLLVNKPEAERIFSVRNYINETVINDFNIDNMFFMPGDYAIGVRPCKRYSEHLLNNSRNGNYLPKFHVFSGDNYSTNDPYFLFLLGKRPRLHPFPRYIWRFALRKSRNKNFKKISLKLKRYCTFVGKYVRYFSFKFNNRLNLFNRSSRSLTNIRRFVHFERRCFRIMKLSKKMKKLIFWRGFPITSKFSRVPRFYFKKIKLLSKYYIYKRQRFDYRYSNRYINAITAEKSIRGKASKKKSIVLMRRNFLFGVVPKFFSYKTSFKAVCYQGVYLKKKKFIRF